MEPARPKAESVSSPYACLVSLLPQCLIDLIQKIYDWLFPSDKGSAPSPFQAPQPKPSGRLRYDPRTNDALWRESKLDRLSRGVPGHKTDDDDEVFELEREEPEDREPGPVFFVAITKS